MPKQGAKDQPTYTKLTDAHCRSAKPRDDVYYMPDRGPESVPRLRLRVRPDGSKHWLLRYELQRPDGTKRESTAGLGAYPTVSLAEARRTAAARRKSVAEGVHPTTARRVAVARNVEAGAATFGVIAAEWLEHNKPGWSAHHYERNKGLIRRVLLPDLKSLPISEITEAMLLRLLRKAYKATPESARRARAVAAQIFRYAKDTHRATTNPARDLADSTVLRKPPVRHFAALAKDDVGPMLQALAASATEPVTKAALVLMLYTGLRDYSLRAARWGEIDLAGATWTVPAERMKSGREHPVPLPRQAVAILTELARLTNKGQDAFVFASRGKSGHLAENTLRTRLHGLGFNVTAHGFRSLITDLLNEQGFNADAVERQLDHVEQSRSRAAYLRSDFMHQRVQMMQWLADWCEAQRDEADAPPLPDNVVSLRRVA